MANDFPTQSRPDTQGNPSLILLFRDEAQDSAGATATASSQQPTGNLVPANGLSDDLGTAVRSGPIVDEPGGIYRYTVKLAGRREVDTISVHHHNVRRPIRGRLYGGDPSSNVPLWDSGWIEPIVWAAPEELDFPEWPFRGGPPERVLANQAARYKLHTPIYAPEPISGVTYVTLEIDGRAGNNLPLPWGDPTESSTFFQFAYLMACKRFRPVQNMRRGWNLGLEDRAVSRVVESGARVGRRRSKARTFTAPLSWLEPAEGYGDMYRDLIGGEGTLGRVFVIPQPHHPSRFHEQAFMATITSQSGVSEFAHELTETTITFTETE